MTLLSLARTVRARAGVIWVPTDEQLTAMLGYGELGELEVIGERDWTWPVLAVQADGQLCLSRGLGRRDWRAVFAFAAARTLLVGPEGVCVYDLTGRLNVQADPANLAYRVGHLAGYLLWDEQPRWMLILGDAGELADRACVPVQTAQWWLFAESQVHAQRQDWHGDLLQRARRRLGG